MEFKVGKKGLSIVSAIFEYWPIHIRKVSMKAICILERENMHCVLKERDKYTVGGSEASTGHLSINNISQASF